MSEEAVHESLLLWENHQSWPLSNSDNNNNNSADLGSGEDKSAGNNNKNQQQQDEDTSQAEPETKQKHKKKMIGCGAGDVMREGKGGDQSDDHIWTERERRKKMRNMFSNLHALLPHLPPKADKATIVDEAVSYIKTLQQTLQKLQNQKLERFHGSINHGFESSLMMNTQNQNLDSSREAFLADQVSSNYDLADKNNATKISNPLSISQFPVTFQTWTSSNVVLNVSGNKAQISVCSPKKPALFTTICYILEKHKMEVIFAHVSSYSNHSVFMIQARASGAAKQLLEAFEMEEMFKEAAGEIMCWVSS